MKPLALFGAISPLPYFYLVTATLGVIFTFIGPDALLPFWRLLLLWLCQTLIPLTFILVVHCFLYRIPGFRQLGNLPKLIVSACIGVAFYTPLAVLVDSWVGQEQLPATGKWMAELLDEFMGVGPPILIGWVALNAPWLLGYQFEQVREIEGSATRQAIEVEASSEGMGDSVTFLPENLDTVMYLKAELHYLTVVTLDNTSLELYNLRDAVVLLSDVEGVSPHRSWWVNLRYVDRFIRDGRQGKLLLKNGVQIPVSRRKMEQVRSLVEERLISQPDAATYLL